MCWSSPRGSGLAARNRRNASSISALVQGLGLDAALDFGWTTNFDAGVEIGFDLDPVLPLPGFDFVAVGLVFRPIFLL